MGCSQTRLAPLEDETRKLGTPTSSEPAVPVQQTMSPNITKMKLALLGITTEAPGSGPLKMTEHSLGKRLSFVLSIKRQIESTKSGKGTLGSFFFHNSFDWSGKWMIISPKCHVFAIEIQRHAADQEMLTPRNSLCATPDVKLASMMQGKTQRTYVGKYDPTVLSLSFDWKGKWMTISPAGHVRANEFQKVKTSTKPSQHGGYPRAGGIKMASQRAMKTSKRCNLQNAPMLSSLKPPARRASYMTFLSDFSEDW